ncbi:MAG: hydroxylamine reductase [Spirochaetes bacterium]|nr:hydroxylamine reductase [Spirochaetota bacterium]
MFCYQCQETARNTGCTVKGVCGKPDVTANLQDLLIYSLKGFAAVISESGNSDRINDATGNLFTESLFMTITNANFDDAKFLEKIREVCDAKKHFAEKYNVDYKSLGGAASYVFDKNSAQEKAAGVGVLSTENEDIRSLTELLIYGLKGLAAYTHHAQVLGYSDPEIYRFIAEALALTLRSNSAEVLTDYVVRTGSVAVTAMALLDKANTETYGNPEITKVNIGVRDNPGILISGHDLKDMKELLEQTKGTGVDVYTHSEMLPANYYPEFKKYRHFVGNYGNAWWKQNEEFEKFNGAILMTTNCITPVKDSYKDRIFTTGMAGYPGVMHIPDRAANGSKDFSIVIEKAKKCKSPDEIETGFITGGFAHNQVMALADKVVAAVKSGAIKKFVVMAGCDGRHASRNYFTEVAKALPADTVILTAGCAKYRYNKLDLGDIGGIPRVLDAGQCNDSYSLAVIALKLKEVFELEDVNDLPLDFDIAWYEQKAVVVLLALLSLGFKGIRLGPTLPGFLSPGVAKVLIDTFNLKGITDVETDVRSITA